MIVDTQGEERHRIEGFLPANDFLAQLTLGLGHSVFARGDFSEAERWFRKVVETYPATDAAPEALYWKGVARYKATGDPAALADTAAQFRQRYQDTSWAKKAKVILVNEPELGLRFNPNKVLLAIGDLRFQMLTNPS